MRKIGTRLTAVLAAVATAALAAGCSTAASGSQAGAGSPGGKIIVVAAENFWGSIASQLGGTKVTETSIISNPNTDPHDYEPTAADARTISMAKLVVVNGIGYDPWATKLLAANPVDGRQTLNVGDLLGLKDGDNPHQWYSAGARPAGDRQPSPRTTSASTRPTPPTSPASSTTFETMPWPSTTT